MTTPFGPPLRTYPDKASFYADHPAAAAGWDWQGHPGTAPLGSDNFVDDNWLVIVCHAADGYGKPGPVVAFERPTGELHVLAASMTYDEARAAFGI